ncbi:protein phosphatase 2C 60 [Pyrus ussuriensis x Pyrus communis]|uniref:Protein phosphatase 2C 60 n=1 Tax=Pyrus ussuriensis x Pyrus communis TaxID=2448454 RepID=A0A5N5FGI9_9ROSA|nr:protein phosphatase 2C 60 [Pyrus ussuriensis x Pyrus communis]
MQSGLGAAMVMGKGVAAAARVGWEPLDLWIHDIKNKEQIFGFCISKKSLWKMMRLFNGESQWLYSKRILMGEENIGQN